MSAQPKYVLTVEEEGETLHRDPGEQCSDFLRQTIDAETAAGLLNAELDPTRRCDYCWPEPA